MAPSLETGVTLSPQRYEQPRRLAMTPFMPTLHADTGLRLALLFIAALWAGVQNQLACGGSFLTLPALMLAGMDARAANITSTVALFPGQVTGGWVGRKHAIGTE